MALEKCSECGHDMSSEARKCPNCGWKRPSFKWWLWIPLALLVASFIWGAAVGPKDTTELAQMETEACIRRQGDGEWRASSGVSLDTFCKLKGVTIGLKRACELNPSKC